MNSPLRLSEATALAVMLSTGALFVTAVSADERGSLTGDWAGSSICVANHDPCRDEKALYHLTGPNERNMVTVIGSKIVDGREIVMGPPADFTYDPEKKTLVFESRAGVFRFTVSSTTLEGTLTVTSGELYRRISLKKIAKAG